MKNKFGITAAAVLVALSLSACSSNNAQQGSSSSKSTSSKVVKNNDSKRASQSSKASSQAPEESRIEKLTAQLRKVFPDMSLPTADGLSHGSDKLNIRYNKSAGKHVIYYSVGNKAEKFNAAELKNEKPYAVLSEYTNASADKAEEVINYSPAQKGLPTKKLDDSTKATTQGAAGSTYVQWNKDNYSFVVQGNNQSKQDPVNRAKEVLALINKYSLPRTSKKASVQVTMGDSEGSLNTVISWQDGKNVYQIKAHDTETALKMLASLKK